MKIKFRFWDKNLKDFEWFGFDDIDYAKQVLDTYYCMLGEKAFIGKIEQFTGVLDKNKKEIYFGDKVRFADKVEWYSREYNLKVWSGRMTKQEALDEIADKPYEERIVENIEDYEWLLSSEIQTYWEVFSNIHEIKNKEE